MKIKRLNFFAKKPQYPEVPFKVKQGIEPHDRDFLSFIYEHKPIFIGGAKFTANHITAKPKKKFVFADILFFVVIINALLYFAGQNVPIPKYIVGNIMAVIFGALIGLMRIEKRLRLGEVGEFNLQKPIRITNVQ